MQEMFKAADYPDLLVGLGSPDDAAVWKLDDRLSLVLTTDFFTPVVDAPRDYGRISAANSLSDVYAMGGTPFLALNIAALPPELDVEIGRQIIEGGAEIARAAGVVVAGGHTIQDKEPKYGLVVAGFVEHERMFTKSGARPGDLLYLTKPLGFGTITTALKQQKAAPEDVAVAVEWMTRLNKAASMAARDCGVRGATDITGYSLLGHASEMASASHVGMVFDFTRVPILAEAGKYASSFIFPGGAFENQEYFSRFVTFARDLAPYEQMLLFDPQTSGGLLLAVPADASEQFESTIEKLGQTCWRIGEVTANTGITVV
jgi:selenide,water dikinase